MMMKVTITILMMIVMDCSDDNDDNLNDVYSDNKNDDG